MGEHLATRQYAPLLVEHGAQQCVGVQQSLHQQVGLALAHHGHSQLGCLYLRAGLDVAHTAARPCTDARLLPDCRTIAHKQGLDKSGLNRTHHGTGRGGIAAAHHSQTAHAAQTGQVGCHVIKSSDRLH